MPATNIEIINEALAQIGVPSITSLSDPTNAAKVASLVYPTALAAILRMHTWGFATRRAELVKVGQLTVGNGNRFSLPEGWLRIVELYNSTQAWKIENRELITTDSAASVKYIFYETDVTKFDPLFVEAFIYYLASKLAYPLTRSQDLANNKYTQFINALSAAKSIDRNEAAPIEIIDMALALLGAPELAKHNDTQTQLIMTIYQGVRDEILAAHPWNFAIKREGMLNAGTTPSFGYSYAWVLPSNCLRVLEVYDETGYIYHYPWVVEAGQLLVDIALSPGIRYIQRVEDVTQFPAEFKNIIIYYLASKLAASITNQPNLVQTNYELYLKSLSIAKQIDNKEVGADLVIDRAIMLLGYENMASLDGEQASIVQGEYNIVRDELLRAYAWNFATKRTTLTNPTTPNHEYTYQYALPEECLRVLDIYNYNESWVVEGTNILTNAGPTIQIRYIERNYDVYTYTPGFVNALVYNLASKLAMTLTQNPGIAAQNLELYFKAVAEAKANEAKETNYDNIVSRALLLLGINQLSFMDNGKISVVNTMYAAARDETLKAHPWNFAVKRSGALTAGSAPSFEYSNSWTLPADCLRVLEVYDNTGAWSSSSWRVESGALLCNLTLAPKIKYIAQITDAAKFSPEYTNALVYNLASKLAPALGQPNLLQPNYELYQKTILEARFVDDKEGGSDIIIAKALVLLGVTSLDEHKTQLAIKLYEDTRNEVLRAHTWNFAMKRSGALTTTTAPSFGFTYAYTLPADCLRVVELYNSTSPWRVENSLLLTNDATAKIKYIAQITDTAKFSANFINALVYNLASKLAFPIANQPAMTQTYYESYKNTINEARLVDSTEGVPVTDIVNQSLALIGVSSIAALDDNQIRVVEKLYTPTLMETLADHEWNFAISRATLTEATPAPTFGYAHKYTLPSDCLRVVELYDSDSEWKVEGGYLLTDDATARIIYIANITDTTKFSPLFTTALQYHLASKFAVPMAKDKGLQKQNYDLYRATIDNARSVDSREGTADDITSNALIEARR